ncbi:MAG: hypothetical protein KDE11_06635 [Rhodobacteraceae bacterium]|nr:hypothetical protein [Paracoccaceae bacterium]
MPEITPATLPVGALLLALCGCTDPAPRCTIPETRDLKTIDKLIAQSQTALERGYVMRQTEGSGVNFCLGGRQSHVGLSFCTDPAGRREAVAIDSAAEKRKLASLEARRDALLATINARMAACGQRS